MVSAKTVKAAREYTAAQITVLEGLEPVRKRPAMYIGDTGIKGLHHLVWEVVDNAIDEAMGGFCNEIVIRLLPDNHVLVSDNGRGIPVDIHKQTKVSALETVLTKLHAGAKFGGSGYKVSGGLHGVGVSVVNALSTWMKAEVRRDGKIWTQEYRRGEPKAKVKPNGKTNEHGTTITFQPDPSVFPEIAFDVNTIHTHLRQQAYLTKGVSITVVDARDANVGELPYVFSFEGGIVSYVAHLNRHVTAKHQEVFYLDKTGDNIAVEIALQYTDEFRETVLSFANNIHTTDGGTHEVGFKTALTRALNSYARKQGILKEKEDNLTGEDVREGLTAVISVKVPDPQFEGQTKGKLGNVEVKPVVDQIFGDAFGFFLEAHPRAAEAILAKCLLTAKARLAARAARDTVLRKGALEGMTLPGKLADCSSRNPAECELFIVEGDSAGGCFSGETKVALTDGRDITFRELVKEHEQGKKNYCYTVKNDGSIAIAPVEHPRQTKKNTEVIRVILDNGEEVVSTPDHQFLLRDGVYKQAQNLASTDSLMPLHRKVSEKGGRITISGYEMVYDPHRDYWVFTHLLADDYNIARSVYTKDAGSHKHHLDFNKRNNNPENIWRITPVAHLEYHRRTIQFTLHRNDVKEKARQAHLSESYREKIRAIMSTPKMRRLLSTRGKKQWADEQYKAYMGEKFLEFYRSNEKYRDESLKKLTASQRLYWSSARNRNTQAKRVTKFFEEHPERQRWLSDLAQKQWQNIELRAWRGEKTTEQWTPEFRAKRKVAYNKTYKRKALVLLRQIFDATGVITKDRYEKARSERNDKSLLRYETILERFYNNRKKRLETAVTHYNHKVVKIERLTERMDVYDMEVAGTHNFALASGVFVHNSAKTGRRREFQAILPLRGKILNVERARLDRMLANNEIKSLIIALGTNFGEQFDLTRLRYGKVVIMTDADVDGAHIRTLLLTLFWRYFPEVIKQGHLFIAQPPLYRVTHGKDFQYAYSDEEKERILKGIKESKSAPNIQRYKGLGEMNPEQLWTTTMDPATRTMKQVTADDAQAADEIFDVLMGAEVAPRKRFIQTHAKQVQNLDI